MSDLTYVFSSVFFFFLNNISVLFSNKISRVFKLFFNYFFYLSKLKKIYKIHIKNPKFFCDSHDWQKKFNPLPRWDTACCLPPRSSSAGHFYFRFLRKDTLESCDPKSRSNGHFYWKFLLNYYIQQSQIRRRSRRS